MRLLTRDTARRWYLSAMFRRLAFLLYLCSLSFAPKLSAQGSPLPVGEEDYDFVRRLAIRYGNDGFTQPATDLQLQPLTRATLVQLVKTYEERFAADFSKIDRYRTQRFYDSNNEWLALPTLNGVEDADRAAFYLGEDFARAATTSPAYRKQAPRLGFLYPSPANLIEVNTRDFYLRLNPVLDFRYGKQQDDGEDYYYNRRGLRLRAGVDDRIFLHFEILESQAGLPNYVRRFRDRFRALPGGGFLKDYELDVANVSSGVDFLNGQGYLSADITRHVGARLGYGNHFIGDGERSLLLSDFSNNYPFLELNWRIWKFHYRNVFAELTDGPARQTPAGVPLAKKYLAAHYLSINLGRRVSLGLFEAVVLSREEGFDLAYLNPVILYRTIEQSVGSPDNALLGFTGRYRSPWRVEAYGQFILDEFVFDELFVERRGWWGNKWAYQIGARYVDAFGLGQLDLVVERNVSRPFTYGHRGRSGYTHFAMPLAHPLGANFEETLVGLDYRPLPRLHLRGRLYAIEQGETVGDNPAAGEDPNRSTSDRDGNFGHDLGQGVAYTNTLVTLRAGYELYPNLWIEGEFLSRSKDSEAAERTLSTTVVNLGVRWNVARRDWAF